MDRVIRIVLSMREVIGKERQKIVDKLESGKTVNNLDSFPNKFKYYILGYILDG